MSNYSKTVNFAVKDGLVTGNPAKVIKGTEIDTEFNNIATMSASKIDDAIANGLLARTGASTASGRTLTGPAAGITVTNGDGVAGNPTLALANDLSALE